MILPSCGNIEPLHQVERNHSLRTSEIKTPVFPCDLELNQSTNQELLKINGICLPALISSTNLDSTPDLHLSLFQYDLVKLHISTRC